MSTKPRIPTWGCSSQAITKLLVLASATPTPQDEDQQRCLCMNFHADRQEEIHLSVYLGSLDELLKYLPYLLMFLTNISVSIYFLPVTFLYN